MTCSARGDAESQDGAGTASGVDVDEMHLGLAWDTVDLMFGWCVGVPTDKVNSLIVTSFIEGERG